VVLRDLPERRIGGGDDGNHLGEGRGGNLGTAPLARHRDAPQTAVGEGIDNLWRDRAAAIAFCGSRLQQQGYFVGNGDGFFIAADDMGIRRMAGIADRRLAF
jgi:hypothetical protein